MIHIDWVTCLEASWHRTFSETIQFIHNASVGFNGCFSLVCCFFHWSKHFGVILFVLKFIPPPCSVCFCFSNILENTQSHSSATVDPYFHISMPNAGFTCNSSFLELSVLPSLSLSGEDLLLLIFTPLLVWAVKYREWLIFSPFS